MLAPCRFLALAGAMAWSEGATAQSLYGEVTSDERVRGLSWSGGKPAVTIGGALPIAQGLDLSGAATTLRNSARHDGAEAGLRLTGSFSRLAGAWRLGGSVTGHVFPGHGSMDFVELGANAVYRIGPLGLRVRADYAPHQRAIGGSNIHLAGEADLAVSGTPWTLLGGIGHSAGAVSDAGRAARLRPRGGYWHYSLGAERIRGPLTVGARWTGTSTGRAAPPGRFADEHTGSRVSAYLRLDI